jgi:hypothetical protein
MMLKSTESVSETDQEVVSDKHLITLATLYSGRAVHFIKVTFFLCTY